jgi:hypothetical protein
VADAVDHNSAFFVEDLVDNAVRTLTELIETGELAFERMKLYVLDVLCKPIGPVNDPLSNRLIQVLEVFESSF